MELELKKLENEDRESERQLFKDIFEALIDALGRQSI